MNRTSFGTCRETEGGNVRVSNVLMMVVFNDGTCHKVQPVLYNPLIKSRTPHKWRIRW